MKIHKVFLLGLVVSAVWSVSAQADNRHHGNNNNNSPQVGSRPAHGNSNSSTSNYGSSVRYSGRPAMALSQHFSSPSMRSTYSAPVRADSIRQRSFNSTGGAAISQRQFTPRTVGRSDDFARSENSRRLRTIQSDRFAQIERDPLNRFNNIQSRRSDRVTQFANPRTQDLGTIRNVRQDRATSLSTGSRSLTTAGTTGNRSLTTAGTGSRIYARRSADWQRNWDRSCDHWWRGHRCRFVNDSWIIFDIGFTPWYGYPYDYYASGYSYYPYGYAPYGYDSGVYGGGYYGGSANYYGDSAYYSSDQYDASTVAGAQEELARLGYYRGYIDGVFGPETRRAVIRYQSDNGLRVTGYLTSDTLQSLGLNRVAAY